MPCRSESASLPNARSKRSFMATRFAIANGDEQSMRILPSWSSGMNPKVGSTTGFTTVRSRPYAAAMGSQ